MEDLRQSKEMNERFQFYELEHKAYKASAVSVTQTTLVVKFVPKRPTQVVMDG